MEYLRGWRVLRQDPEWKNKLLTGSLLLFLSGFIPVLPQVVLAGWHAVALRWVVSGRETPMPRLDLSLDYLGKFMTPGFKVFIVRLVWSAPLIFLGIGLCLCGYISFFAALMGGASAASGGDGGALVSVGGMVCMGLGALAMIIVSILAPMPLTIATIRAELSDDMSQGMRFGDVLKMTRGLFKELLIGHFVIGLISIGVIFFGVLTCYVGLYPGLFVLGVINVHFHAQIYEIYRQRGGEPLPIGPLDVEAPPAPPQAPPPNAW